MQNRPGSIHINEQVMKYVLKGILFLVHSLVKFLLFKLQRTES